MTQVFTCPQCGAPQEAPTTPVSAIECPYCGHNVIVPPELRVAPEPDPVAVEQPPTIVVDLRDELSSAAPVVRGVGRWLTCIIGVIILAALATIIIPLLAVPTALQAGADIIEEVAIPAASPTPSFATLEMSFGQQGVGAGMFEDARSIAVDGQRRIYVGDYQGGRVQVFDPTGKFLTQWMVDPKIPLVSLAAKRDGTVYIVQGGELTFYNGDDGAPLGTFDYGDDFNDVFTTLDGGMLAAYGGVDDDLLRFDANGELKLSIPEAISGQTGDSELDMHVAEDGLGNMYALGLFNDAVFKYNAEGKYLNKFGSAGDEPGQFRAAADITVDGKGRIYVSDIQGVQVFDSEGRFLGWIDVEGAASGLITDDQNSLYVAARTKIYKYSIP